MSVRLLWALIASILLATACQSGGDTSTEVRDAPATPTGGGMTPTVAVDVPQETAAPATPTAVPATAKPEPAPTSMPGDGSAEASAADADVLFVHAAEESDGSWTFRVTVTHPDTGWEDYADGWDVVTPDGAVLKPNPDDAFTRVLLHPHENEQPFTRSQRGILIPEGVTTVTVRAHDLVDGFGGREVQVDLGADAGPDFEVERQP